ncbi:MAG: glycosyltransferase [Planctomycetota bacterium]
MTPDPPNAPDLTPASDEFDLDDGVYDVSGEPAAGQPGTSTNPRVAALTNRRRADPMLLEIAWEACNQVGGIYTVLRSKIPTMLRRWGNSRYCLVGPYQERSAQVEFEPAPLVGPMGKAVQRMREIGIGAEYGRWLVTGRPHLVLLHLPDTRRYLDDIKYRLWADHHIPTPGNDELLNDVVAFAESIRVLLTVLGEQEGHRRKLIAHVHEWMAGGCIPMLRKESWPGSLVFTTHATLLGRYLAMNSPVYYDHLPFYNTAEEAKNYNVEAQHGLERAAAHGSHVFSTVSDVTAFECEHILGRKCDVVLPNGINIERFAAVHEFQHLHDQYKQRLHEFTIGHFFPHYTFDLDTTLYAFTAGRYEYRNKGMDLTIEALARLNHRLKEQQAPVTLIFLIITKAPHHAINVQLLHNAAALQDFRKIIGQYQQQIGDKLFFEATAGRIPDLNLLVDDYWRLRLRRNQQAWKRDGLPPFVTHDLLDEGKDPVITQLKACGLFNAPEDKVKVVFHPDFVTATNPLFGLDYDQFVRGCHLGVFPSYYEPWGYTPLECIASGVPAVTSDLSGFGSYVGHLNIGTAEQGLHVNPRRGHHPHDSAEALARYLETFCQTNRRDRINLRNAVEDFAQHFDWNNLGRRYDEAHGLALDRLG